MQYTIRNIPDYLDATLRDVARREGKSLNEVAVASLVRGAGLVERERVKRDLSDIAGTWAEDPAFDRAIADQQKIDEAIWQ
jgi:plasmid stability protein